MKFKGGLFIFIAFGAGGCGLGVPSLAEFYDWGDPSASLNMQLQVKRAIYCELREASKAARRTSLQALHDNKTVTTLEDISLPPTWGAQIELSFTVNEKSTLSPNVAIKTPLPDVPVNFKGQVVGVSDPFIDAVTYGPRKIGESFSIGLGGELSSEANRIDKYNYYYTMEQIIDDDDGKSTCSEGRHPFGPDSRSSPFLVKSNLGLKEWLPDAVIMNGVLRSSRSSKTGIGKPLGDKSDSFSYNIKFVILSSGRVSPTWDLVRVATSSSPLFDAGRTRTHELLITIGPGAKADFTPIIAGKIPKYYTAPAGPSQATTQAHLASQIGNAVARALRGQ